jgi:DNA primase
VATYAPSLLDDIRSGVDIVDLVGRFVNLKKSGVNWKGLCPFHGEKTPSFTVSPSKQFYHCFGCGVHGNAIGFMMAYAGMGYVDAVKDLASSVGMQVPEWQPRTPEEAARKERETDLYGLMEKAMEFYRAELKKAPRAIEYLKGRGLTGEIAARFRIGYAPEGWQGLEAAFEKYDDKALVECGLVIVNDEGKRYDRFRDRVMFPILSTRGAVIGFGGRVLGDGEPKYLNSPETPVFSKGRELYGLYEGRAAIRQRGHALVVEGYMDVVALAQSGFGNAVATLGTACTAEHVQKLFRFTDSVVFSFDGDAAGRRAAGRALEASLPHATDTRTVRFLFLPPEHDPDSYVRELGAEAFERCIAEAVPLSRQLVEAAKDGVDMATAEGRARFVAQARPLWSAVPEGMLKRQLLGQIASLAALPVEELAQAWQTQAAPAARPPAVRRARSAAGRRMPPLPEDRALWALLLECGWWAELGAEDHEALCGLESWHGEAFRLVDRASADEGALPWAALRERIAAEAWGGKAVQLVDAEDPAIEPSLEDLKASIRQLRQSAKRLESMRILGWR